MTPPFGLPANYTSNPMYLQYMQLMMQSAQQQQKQAAPQQQELQNIMLSKQKQQDQQNHYAQMALQQAQASQTVNSVSSAQAVKGDEKDDGKISFGSKIKNFGKGIGKFFTGMVCDDSGKFSWKRTLTTVAVAAGAVALTVATGGAATPFLIAAGAAIGTVQVGKGTYKAITAKTDKEAEKAWQDIGGGTTAVVASIAGAKGALKSAGKVDVSGYKGITGSLKATGKCFTESGRMTKAGYNNLRTDFSGTLTNAKEVGLTNLKAKFNNENALIAFKEKSVSKFDKEIARLEKKIGKTTDSNKLAELNRELTLQKANREQLLNQMSTMEGKLPNEYQTVIDKSKKDLATFEKALAESKEQSGHFWQRSASEKRLIQQQKDVIKHIENEIKTLEEYKKVASAGYKKTNAESIQTNKDIVKAYKEDIKNYKSQLKAETDPTAKKAIQDKIDLVKKDIETFENSHLTKGTGIRENYAFAKAKYVTPGIKELKTNKLWTGTAAVNNGFLPSIKIAPDMISEADLYAQQYGFQSAQQMQEYVNAMQGSEQALSSADELLKSNTASSNPYMAYMQSMNQMQMPQGNNFGFNDLYVSPYPDMI